MSTPRSVVLERLAYTLAAPVLAAAPNLSPTTPSTPVSCWPVPPESAAGSSPPRARKPVPDARSCAGPRWSSRPPSTSPPRTRPDGVRGGWTVCSPPAGGRPAASCCPSPATPAATTAPPSPPPPRWDLPSGPRRRWAARRRRRPAHPAGPGAVGAGRDAGAHPHRQRRPASRDAQRPHRPAARPETGRPISGLSEAHVAAAFGVDESDVQFASVAQQPGRQGGPGWLEARITPDANARRRQAPTAQERWTDRIGGPGAAHPAPCWSPRTATRSAA